MNIQIPIFFISMLFIAPNVFAVDETHWTIKGPTAVTFDWRGSSSENSIRFGTASNTYTRTVTAVHPSPLPTSSSGPFWEAKLTGLTANTLYYYRIGSNSERTFRTPPSTGSCDFTVYAEGDIGSSRNYSQVTGVQSLISSASPKFVLAVGDLTYGDTKGAASVDQHFNDVMVWSQRTAYMPAWGNHDMSTSSAQLNEYEGRFDLPNSQSSPGASNMIGNGPADDWSWFDYCHVRFISYPEPYSSSTWSDWKTKADALMDAAQSSSSVAYIVTFGHRPAYSSGSAGSNTTLRSILDTLGSDHDKYVLNVNGHSHNYERTYPRNGVVHITAGTGGAPLATSSTTCLWKSCTAPSWSAFRAFHHGAARLHFTFAVDTSGHLIPVIDEDFICGPAQSGKNDVSCSSGSVLDSYTIQ